MSKETNTPAKKPVTKKANNEEVQVVPSVSMLMQQAIDKGVPVETMERLLAMRRELKVEFAKEQYDKAMADFQADCPTIEKTKEVKTDAGQVAYRYAPIETIVEQVKEPLKKHGFSYSVKQQMNEASVKVTCVVKHADGHSEEYDMEVPLGNKTRIMSDTQVVAAASTYAKRYAFCNAFGILTGDEDNDGKEVESKQNATQKKETPQEQFERAKALINNINDSAKLFEVLEGVKGSKIYNKDQKAQLSKIISSKIDEINSQN